MSEGAEGLRSLLVGGVDAGGRHLGHLVAELAGAHRQIGQELVAIKDGAEGLHLRIEQVVPRIGAIALRCIGQPMARRQALNRRMQYPDRDDPAEGRVAADATPDEARGLDITIAIVEEFVEARQA